MVMQPFYYVRTQEKCEIALLDMFNNIRINKYSDFEKTNVIKTVHVPVVFHVSKYFSNHWQNSQSSKKPLPIPCAGLKYKNKEPNAQGRTQTTYARNIYSKDAEQWIQDIQPTPYFLFYDLEFLTESYTEAYQINENVIPYFNIKRCLRIKEYDFLPDLERQIPVYLQSSEDVIEDELDGNSGKKFVYKLKYTFRLEVDFYRPFEIPEMIKYAELNLTVNDILQSMQVIVLPTNEALGTKKAWETVTDTSKKGYSILKTIARTLVEEQVLDEYNNIVYDYNGVLQDNWKIIYKDITVTEGKRPTSVPDWKMLHLTFDEDSPIAIDETYFNKDYVALNNINREFIDPLSPGAGASNTDGYYPSSTNWNKIIDWFGTNNGLHESPFNFSITLQFKDFIVGNTIFQFLYNEETVVNNKIVPTGEIFFEWGIIDKKLYFTLKTYGDNFIYYKFETENELQLNNSDIYTFNFLNYEFGHEGLFTYSKNNLNTIVLKTTKKDLRYD